MGRKRSEYICPKCGQLGYLHLKPSWNGSYPDSPISRYYSVVHYNHQAIKKRSECYVDPILKKSLSKKMENMTYGELVSDMVQSVYIHAMKIEKTIRKFHQIYSHPMSDYESTKIGLRILELFKEQESAVILLKKLPIWKIMSRKEAVPLSHYVKNYLESGKKLFPFIKKIWLLLKEIGYKLANNQKYKRRRNIMSILGASARHTRLLMKDGLYCSAAFFLLTTCFYIKYYLPQSLEKKLELAKRLSNLSVERSIWHSWTIMSH